METTRQILIVGQDPALEEEFLSALDGVKSFRSITNFASNYTQGIEMARSRRPHLVCVEMGRDTRALTTFAEEIRIGAPEAVVVAVYRKDIFQDGTESAVIISALRANVQDFLRRPLSTSEVEQLFQRLFVDGQKDRRKDLGSVVSFVSNKGGVGKSTTSLSVACTLAARHPDRVLLIDASLQLGVCASMLGMAPKTSILDAVRERDRLDETLIRQLTVRHHSGLRLLAAPRDAVEAAEVDDEVMSRILTLSRRAYDFVIVDTFPVLDSVTVAILDLSDLSYIVLQPSVPNVAGALRYIDVLDGLGFPQSRQRLVLNCNLPNFTAALKPADVADRLDRDLDHVLPFQKKVLTAMNTGEPYVLHTSRMMGYGKRIKEIAAEIESLLGTDRVGLPAGMHTPSQGSSLGDDTGGSDPDTGRLITPEGGVV